MLFRSDQRNLKLDELSTLTDFTSAENNKGQLQVYLDGQLLVSHQNVRQLTNTQTITNPMTGEPNALNSIIWADNATAVEIGSGSLRATLDMRDGNTVDDVGLPYLSQQLDKLATSLADSFNEIHEAGWTLPDSDTGLASQTGVPFFTSALDLAGNPLPMGAANIRVNPAIETNLKLIAASGEQVTSAALAGNNISALKMTGLFESTTIAGIGSFDGFINSFVSTIAVEASMANNRADNQNSLVESIDQQRQSISGVSLDEETSNLIKFQHSYSAAARVITTIDEMLDILINRTGMVGR